MVTPIRIVLTVASLAPEFGGPVTKALSLASALRAVGQLATVVGAGTKPLGDDDSPPEIVALAPALAFHGTPIPWSMHRISLAVRDADVLHVIGLRDPVGTIAALTARALGIPYVIEPAGMFRRQFRSLALKSAFDVSIGRAVIAGARRIIATSAMEAEELVAGGVDAGRVHVRSNGIVAPPLRPRGAFRARIGIAHDTPLVLTLGRIAMKKGLVPLVEVLSRMPDVHLAIAGPDSSDGTLPRLRETVDRLALGQRVHILAEPLYDTDKADALTDADVFCLWSLHENFGQAAGEAAACGTAVVVSDQCGVAEWLGAGVEVVPSGDHDKLLRRLDDLLAHPARRTQLAAEGRAAALRLDWNTLAQQQLLIYGHVA